jgi:hypothetical protein
MKTLRYWVAFDNAPDLVLYEVHGITDFEISFNNIHVFYDDLSPIAGMYFPIYGELVKIELVNEVKLNLEVMA